ARRHRRAAPENHLRRAAAVARQRGPRASEPWPRYSARHSRASVARNRLYRQRRFFSAHSSKLPSAARVNFRASLPKPSMTGRKQELNLQFQEILDGALLVLAFWAAHVLRFYATRWFSLETA